MKTQFSLPKSLGSLVLAATILVSVACSNHEKKDNDMSYYKANPSDASSQAMSTDQPPPQSAIASSQKNPNISRTTPTQALTKNSEEKQTSPLAEESAKLPLQATQQAAMQRTEKVEGIDEETATKNKGGGQKETVEKVTNLTVTNQNKPHYSQIGENSNVAENNSLTKPDSGKVENMTEIQPPNPRVLFYVTDQRKLNEEQLETIKYHAGFLAVHPHYVIQIHGHTDSQGPVDYNDKLARERAQIIADQLVSAGVDSKQIEVFGWGSADPLLSVSQYDKNRRVELVYLGNQITLSEKHDSSPEQNAEVIESP